MPARDLANILAVQVVERHGNEDVNRLAHGIADDLPQMKLEAISIVKRVVVAV